MIIVDTNVVSELMRPSPSPAVTDWVRTRGASELYTTSITFAEIRYGIERLPDGHRKELLRTTADDVFAAFEEHVLPFDAKAAVQYATIVTHR
ncbi:MAG: PIN domain-containing protein, partial [Pseudonocardiaceae bacterium]